MNMQNVFYALFERFWMLGTNIISFIELLTKKKCLLISLQTIQNDCFKFIVSIIKIIEHDSSDFILKICFQIKKAELRNVKGK